MPIDNHILNVIEHSLELDTIKFDAHGEDEGGQKMSHEIGGPIPMVVINGASFTGQDVKRFEIDCSTKIPKLALTIIDTRGTFDADQIPRDGDVV